jgi:hypothetical protein
VILIFLLSVTAASLWAHTEALAAAPEAPEVTVESPVHAETANLRGVLNPGKEGEGGTYEFLYKASKTECAGASHAPASPGLSLGLEREEVFETLSGLEPNTQYKVCLRAENTKGEATVGPAVTFKTALPPETPETKPASEVTGTTVTLNGVLNPQNEGDPGAYEFFYEASATECKEGQTTLTGTALGHTQEAVSTGVTGLLPSTQYTFCLLARNEAGETAIGAPVTFTTPAMAPTVAEQSISNVGSTTATLSAQIDPGGTLTTYHVEYGTTPKYGFATPEVSLPASSASVGVQAQLATLEPDTEYHFRFVAKNALGAAPPGADTILRTAQSLGASELVLPDNRAYERVSPPGNVDVYVPATTNLYSGLASDQLTYFMSQAATDGNGVAFEGGAPPSGGNGREVASGLGNLYLAKREPSGWMVSDITPAPPSIDEHKRQAEIYRAFSDDLSVGILQSTEGANGVRLTGDGAACDGLYARTSSDGVFHALFATTPAPPLGPLPERCFGETFQAFAGASAGSTHILFQTGKALTVEAEPAEEEGKENLYDSVGGQLHSVNLLNNGHPDPNATYGAPPVAVGEAFRNQDFSNVISADGSRIFWTDLNTEVTAENPVGTRRLFVRKNDIQPQSPVDSHSDCTVLVDACTVQIDATRGPGSSGGGRFWTATGDGSKVFFTDCSRLTEDSTAVSGACEHVAPGNVEAYTGNDLYEYEVGSGHLTDLTVDHNGDSLGADVQGVLGTSADGSYVYFVAAGALAPGASPRTCEAATEGKEQAEEKEGKLPAGRGCNLYVRHRGEPLKFIATLAADDNQMPGLSQVETTYGDWHPSLGARTAAVTPDGRHLVFESRRSLTGYDNVVSHEPAVEAFVYADDAARLSCVSCNPSGAPPTSSEVPAAQAGQEGLLPTTAEQKTYMLHWISEDGSRVFFDTAQPLVSQDTNHLTDVYEWEREGAPSCPPAVHPRPNGGCVYLLSGGTSTDISLLIDASANGSDVFFLTRGKLIPQDHNDNVKLYDARVGGGFPETSLACTGTGCQGVPPASPLFETPSSATFNGVGNFPPPPPTKGKTAAQIRAGELAKTLKVCKRDKSRKKRTVCEKQARKKYGAAKAKRAGNGRRAGR